ncbi:MAG: hypothetical protein M0Z28_29645, partial [Rhodospirillales bacterium]|nr:hypothetical protein [Rhodospirillales bacterium]
MVILESPLAFVLYIEFVHSLRGSRELGNVALRAWCAGTSWSVAAATFVRRQICYIAIPCDAASFIALFQSLGVCCM